MNSSATTTQAPPPLVARQVADEHAEASSPRRRWFPSAFTVLLIVLLGVWLLAFVVPAGQYEVNDAGAPIPGTYSEVPAPQSFGDRVKDFFFAPINGLYGIQGSETGAVDPDASGFLYGSAGVFLFVLAIGMFITVMFATGALDRGIARLAYAVRGHGWLLIVAIMSVFSLLGTVEGMAEETLGFYALVVPLMLALGYDRMVAVGVIIVGAGVGVMGSTVNPFSVGIASGSQTRRSVTASCCGPPGGSSSRRSRSATSSATQARSRRSPAPRSSASLRATGSRRSLRRPRRNLRRCPAATSWS